MKHSLLALTLTVGSTIAASAQEVPPPRAPSPSPPGAAGQVADAPSPDQIQEMVNRAVDLSVERISAKLTERMAQLQQQQQQQASSVQQATYASPQVQPAAAPQQVTYAAPQTQSIVVPVTMGQPVAAPAYVDVLVEPGCFRRAAATVGRSLAQLGEPCSRRMQVAPAATTLVQAVATYPAQQTVTQVVAQPAPVALPAAQAPPVSKALPALPAKATPTAAAISHKFFGH